MITCYKKRRIAQADAQCHLVKKFEGIVPPLRGSGIRLKLIYNHIIPSGI